MKYARVRLTIASFLAQVVTARARTRIIGGHRGSQHVTTKNTATFEILRVSGMSRGRRTEFHKSVIRASGCVSRLRPVAFAQQKSHEKLTNSSKMFLRRFLVQLSLFA